MKNPLAQPGLWMTLISAGLTAAVAFGAPIDETQRAAVIGLGAALIAVILAGLGYASGQVAEQARVVKRAAWMMGREDGPVPMGIEVGGAADVSVEPTLDQVKVYAVRHGVTAGS